MASEPEPEGRLLLGLIYERLGNPRTAIGVYRKLSGDSCCISKIIIFKTLTGKRNGYRRNPHQGGLHGSSDRA